MISLSILVHLHNVHKGWTDNFHLLYCRLWNHNLAFVDWNINVTTNMVSYVLKHDWYVSKYHPPLVWSSSNAYSFVFKSMLYTLLKEKQLAFGAVMVMYLYVYHNVSAMVKFHVRAFTCIDEWSRNVRKHRSFFSALQFLWKDLATAASGIFTFTRRFQ